MSYPRTKPLNWTPEIEITSGSGSNWTLGSYVEALALTPGIIQIVAFAINYTASASQVDAQIVMATGVAGSEIPLGHRRTRTGYVGGDSILGYLFRVPLTVGAGERVSLAYQVNDINNFAIRISFGYTIADTSDQVTSLTYKAIPDTQASVAITPSGTAWTYTNWVQISDGSNIGVFGDYLTGIIPNPPTVNSTSTFFQMQVGLGPAQDVITTFKASSVNNAGRLIGNSQGISFPRPYFVNPGTSVWVRLATGDTNVSNWSVSFEALTAGPGLGSIRVNKVVVPVADTTQFTIDAGGGLAPTSFVLGSNGTQLFPNILAGSGYTILEIVPEGWAATYDVSNGSQIDNIVVGSGENVIVTITNTKIANVFSGIYQLVPGKTNDTLWASIIPEETVDVKIPDPFAKTAMLGD